MLRPRTVFLDAKTDDKPGELQAVHSRHTAMPGGAATSQYSGACIIEK
jgi:hypothetical protein